MHMRGFFLMSRQSLIVGLLASWTLCFCGCRHDNAAPDPSQSSSILNRLPAPVVAAFRHDHPHIAPASFHVRLFPDGTTHYQLIYLDNTAQPREADYYPDGRPID